MLQHLRQLLLAQKGECSNTLRTWASNIGEEFGLRVRRHARKNQANQAAVQGNDTLKRTIPVAFKQGSSESAANPTTQSVPARSPDLLPTRLARAFKIKSRVILPSKIRLNRTNASVQQKERSLSSASRQLRVYTTSSNSSIVDTKSSMYQKATILIGSAVGGSLYIAHRWQQHRNVAHADALKVSQTNDYNATHASDQQEASSDAQSTTVVDQSTPSESAGEQHDEGVTLPPSDKDTIVQTNMNGTPVTDWKSLIKPQLLRLIASIVFAIGASVVSTLSRKYGGSILDLMQKKDTRALVQAGLRLIGSLVVQSALHLCFYACLSSAVEEIATNLRKNLISNIVCQDQAFHDTHTTGELIQRVTSDVMEIKIALKHCISMGVGNIFNACAGIISMFMQSPMLTIALGTVLPTSVLIGSFLASMLRRMSRKIQQANALAATLANESISNIKTVQAFVAEHRECEKYAAQLDKATMLSQRYAIAIGLFQALSNIALNGTILGIMALGGHLTTSNSLSTGDLVSFITTAWTVQSSLASLSVVFTQVMRALDASNRLFELLNTKPVINSATGQILPPIKGSISIRDVSFIYPSRPNSLVLDKVNLELPPGKVVSLVGPSGSGKSTIYKLLVRFYDPVDGALYLDGHDIRDLDPHWLRQQIGVVEQEPTLFYGTIAENIAYGVPNATREQIEEAAKSANCHDFITNFPNGYDTMVGESSNIQLSGGQKQRIAIARAMLKNPRILVLDEATSALDAESESLVQVALQTLMKDKTTLIIAHRLSTIKNSDLIVVLDKGRVVETGTHASLMAKGGVYAKLVRQQYPDEVDAL